MPHATWPFIHPRQDSEWLIPLLYSRPQFITKVWALIAFSSLISILRHNTKNPERPSRILSMNPTHFVSAMQLVISTFYIFAWWLISPDKLFFFHVNLWHSTTSCQTQVYAALDLVDQTHILQDLFLSSTQVVLWTSPEQSWRTLEWLSVIRLNIRVWVEGTAERMDSLSFLALWH